MLNEKILIKKLQAIKPDLVTKYAIKSLGYFGSYANGNMTEQSDVDILVDFSTPIGYDFFRVQDDLEKILEKKVDLVTPAALRTPLKETIYSQLKLV